MKALLRSIAAVLASLLVLLILLSLVELFGTQVYPFPKDFKHTQEATCEYVKGYPQWVLAVVVPAWGFTAFAGTWTAQRIGSLYSAAIVGLLLLAMLATNLSMLPYPTWFKIANLLLIPTATLAGARLAMRRTPAIKGAGDGKWPGTALPE